MMFGRKMPPSFIIAHTRYFTDPKRRVDFVSFSSLKMRKTVTEDGNFAWFAGSGEPCVFSKNVTYRTWASLSGTPFKMYEISPPRSCHIPTIYIDISITISISRSKYWDIDMFIITDKVNKQSNKETTEKNRLWVTIYAVPRVDLTPSTTSSDAPLPRIGKTYKNIPSANTFAYPIFEFLE